MATQLREIKKDHQRQGKPPIEMFHLGKKGKVWKLHNLNGGFESTEVYNMLVYMEKKTVLAHKVLILVTHLSTWKKTHRREIMCLVDKVLAAICCVLYIVTWTYVYIYTHIS